VKWDKASYLRKVKGKLRLKFPSAEGWKLDVFCFESTYTNLNLLNLTFIQGPVLLTNDQHGYQTFNHGSLEKLNEVAASENAANIFRQALEILQGEGFPGEINIFVGSFTTGYITV
jgi:hypothetical protein